MARKYDDPTQSAFNEVYRTYRRNAQTRKRDFALSPKRFRTLIKGNCYYCGVEPLQKIKGLSHEFTYNGIDRIDNSKGYIAGNVVACCQWCNRFKANLDHETFLNHVANIVKYQLSKLFKTKPRRTK